MSKQQQPKVAKKQSSPEAKSESAAESPSPVLPTELQAPVERKVAIVGTAPSSLNLAPMGDESWEIWTCSLLPMPHMGLPRWNRHFELHRFDELGQWENMPPDQRKAQVDAYVKFMQEQTVGPIYLNGQPPVNIPLGKVYPLDEILQTFQRRYFTSTIAYMIALALAEGVKTIGLFGVDMSLNSERYSHQRACLEYFVGLCDGSGINMMIPDECDLMKAAQLYAFGHEDAMVKRLAARKAHIQTQKGQLQNQIKQMEQQIIQARMALAGYSGVSDDLDWVASNWTNGLPEYINGAP